jgi:hypothetical protein
LNAVFVGDDLFAFEHVERMARNQRDDARDLGEYEQPDQPPSEAARLVQPKH